MHRLLVNIFIVCLWTLSCPISAQDLPIVNIGFISDGDSPRFAQQTEVMKREIEEITRGEFEVRFPEAAQVNGGWDEKTIRNAVNRLFADDSLDLLIATGPVGSQELITRKQLAKPSIATVIIDIALQGAPLSKGKSGVRNLNYIASPDSFERDLAALTEIVKLSHLSILVTDAILERLPQLKQRAALASTEYGIKFDLVPVGSRAESALTQLRETTSAVMVTPLIKMSRAEFLLLSEGLKKRKLPSFSMHGRDEVELGIFASIAPKSDVNRLARRVAINVLSILTGEDAGSLPVTFSMGERLAVNMETARAIDLYPNWSTLSEAERIKEERPANGNRLTLLSAVNEAIESNLDLIVANQEVAVGQHSIPLARSALLPQLDSSVSGEARERGIANINQPQRSASGSFRLSQILYSDSAWANLQNSGRLQEALEFERDSTKLDIILDTSTAYLSILKAKTIERLQKENVRRSRQNLELARVRESIGQSSRADVYRWESEIATDRQEALASEAARLQAELNLNRLLNRPQNEAFTLKDADISDPLLLISDPRFFSYVENQKKWFVFHDYMAEQGLINAPELMAIMLNIDAQERIITNARRQYWVPEISVQGGFNDTFTRGGASSALPPGMDDGGWNMGLTARLPLFQGGARKATLARERDDLLRLHYTRHATQQKIEARIRNGLHNIGASYPSIELARKAADASASNLELITESYRAGSVSLIKLIDAQNAALSADLSAANAIYDFLLDLMEVQRATASFDFFMTPEQRRQWYESIEAYYEKANRS